MATAAKLESITFSDEGSNAVYAGGGMLPTRERYRTALAVFVIPNKYDGGDVSARISLAIDILDHEADAVERAWRTFERWLSDVGHFAQRQPEKAAS